MNAQAGEPPRRCVECGKPIVRRRTTAVYCSGKCREIYNARKRRQARNALKNATPLASIPEPECAPKSS